MKINCTYPTIDSLKTGENIMRLRKAAGYSVKDLQAWFNFPNPQAIYKWQRGKNMPSLDNLIALASIFHVKVDDLIICIDRFDGRMGNDPSCD